MVRSLAIRQIFVLLDLVLFFLILAALALLVSSQFRKAPALSGVETQFSGAEESAGLRFHEVASRSEYEAILSSGLFGPAGRKEAPAPPPPPPPPDPDEELTKLNLRLLGTVALSPGNPFSSATIENLDQPGNSRSYALEDNVMDRVKLAEVRPREVVLLNERENPPSREVLRMDDEDASEAMLASASRKPKPAPGRGGNDDGPDRVMLKRREMVKLIQESYADLVTKVRPEMVRDSGGNIIGVTTDNISQFELAKKLGLSDGDVLQTVNSERIDSEQKIMEMVQKYGDARSFRIGIMRNGKPREITYRLD